jgi:2-amino-4-hydroxy-6-hydroxymethyldihydropteridine diphosphokinase
MLARMLRIEYLLGRRDKNLHKPRTVDLDLLLYGNHQCVTEFLTVPHSRLHERKFVLVPACGTRAARYHPICNKPSGICLHFEDDSAVKRWNPITGNAKSNPIYLDLVNL